MQPSQGSVTVGLDEPLLRALDPRLGRVIVIESSQYAVPWVGAIMRRDRSPGDGTARLTLVSLDALLRDRQLSPTSSYAKSAGEVFRDIIDEVNAQNPTEITVAHDIAAGPPYAAAFPDRSAYGALTTLCRDCAHEWWVDYTVAESGISATARFEPARGYDRHDDTVLIDGANCEVLEDGIDLGGSFFGSTLVAGQTSALEAYTERSRITQQQSSGFQRSAGVQVGQSGSVHGYEIAHADLSTSPLTRRERVRIAEHLRSEGAIAAAAEVEMGRPRTAERVAKLRIVSTDAGLWAKCDIGSVVRFRSEEAFGEGYDGPVRIVSVQPFEENGDLTLAAQELKVRVR